MAGNAYETGKSSASSILVSLQYQIWYAPVLQATELLTPFTLGANARGLLPDQSLYEPSQQAFL